MKNQFVSNKYTTDLTMFAVYLPGSNLPSTLAYILCCTIHKLHHILYMRCYMYCCSHIHNIREDRLDKKKFS